MRRKVLTLCDNGWNCQGCPEVFADDIAELAKQMGITDDFGNTVFMSKEQFQIFVEKAKKGELDTAC